MATRRPRKPPGMSGQSRVAALDGWVEAGLLASRGSVVEEITELSKAERACDGWERTLWIYEASVAGQDILAGPRWDSDLPIDEGDFD